MQNGKNIPGCLSAAGSITYLLFLFQNTSSMLFLYNDKILIWQGIIQVTLKNISVSY